MKTKTIRVIGETRAVALALKLIKLSQWYALEPLPDDQWRLTVKEELPFGDITDANHGHQWREVQNVGLICDGCLTSQRGWVTDPFICPLVNIQLPVTALVVGNSLGKAMNVALVANYRDGKRIHSAAQYFAHAADPVDVTYCRTERDAVRLLYEMNDEPEPYIRIEYDRDYRGGNYSGVGQHIYLSVIDVDPSKEDEVYAAFEEQTELPRSCVIHYSEDERFDRYGSPLDS